jgi:hypothetical protein
MTMIGVTKIDGQDAHLSQRKVKRVKTFLVMTRVFANPITNVLEEDFTRKLRCLTN